MIAFYPLEAVFFWDFGENGAGEEREVVRVEVEEKRQRSAPPRFFFLSFSTFLIVIVIVPRLFSFSFFASLFISFLARARGLRQ